MMSIGLGIPDICRGRRGRTFCKRKNFSPKVYPWKKMTNMVYGGGYAGCDEDTFNNRGRLATQATHSILQIPS